jgi:hypothetical protein
MSNTVISVQEVLLLLLLIHAFVCIGGLGDQLNLLDRKVIHSCNVNQLICIDCCGSSPYALEDYKFIFDCDLVWQHVSVLVPPFHSNIIYALNVPQDASNTRIGFITQNCHFASKFTRKVTTKELLHIAPLIHVDICKVLNQADGGG